MKIIIVSLTLLVPFLVSAQGFFLGANSSVPTRIGTMDGSLAGAGYWAQFIVGTNLDSLTPVGMALEHANGRIVISEILVPGIDGGRFAYLQMVAWNGILWGTSLDSVPQDQLGRTDVVFHYLAYSFQPSFTPSFTQPAIVPVPEPSTFASSALGIGVLWLASRTRRNNKR